MKKKRRYLNSVEYNLVNALAKKTGLDCWFSILGHTERINTEPGLNFYDYYYNTVYDLECKREISLSVGMQIFVEGLTKEDLQRLTQQEREILYQLCDDIGVVLAKDLFIY